MEPNRSIAEAIAVKIKESGTNPNAISRATGIPLTTFNRKLGNGGLDYTVGELRKIAQALDTSSVDLLGVTA